MCALPIFTVFGSWTEEVTARVKRLLGRAETGIGRGATPAPGGKGANQAAAAGVLGAGVHMVGRVGQDPAGDRRLAALAGSRGDGSQGHRTPGGPPGSGPIPGEAGSAQNPTVAGAGANAQRAPGEAGGECRGRAGG